MNPGIFLWIQDLVESPVAKTKKLLGSAYWSRATDNPPKCQRCSAGSSIWLQRAQKAEGSSRSLWRRPNQDRLRILASNDYPSLCGWEGSQNSAILLTYHLLDVECLLAREHEVRQWAGGHLLGDLSAFLGPHGHMIVRKRMACSILKGFNHRLSLNTWCMVDYTGCGGKGTAVAAFLSCFEEFFKVSQYVHNFRIINIFIY